MRSPHGAVNQEWGRKNRKEEDRLRGLNNRGRREAVAEGTASVSDFPTGGSGEICGTCEVCDCR